MKFGFRNSWTRLTTFSLITVAVKALTLIIPLLKQLAGAMKLPTTTRVDSINREGSGLPDKKR